MVELCSRILMKDETAIYKGFNSREAEKGYEFEAGFGRKKCLTRTWRFVAAKICDFCFTPQYHPVRVR